MIRSFTVVLALVATCLLPACTGVRFSIDHRDLSVENVDDIYRHELDYIVTRRQAVAEFLAKHNPEAAKEITPVYHSRAVMGLAFSGGGIRSATFNLGVMQALERSNRLHAFDYLSTVSGGSCPGGAGDWRAAPGIGAGAGRAAACARGVGLFFQLHQYSVECRSALPLRGLPIFALIYPSLLQLPCQLAANIPPCGFSQPVPSELLPAPILPSAQYPACFLQ